MQEITAIIFDYGNVIARFDHRIFFNRIASYSPLSIPELLDAVRNGSQLIVDYECGRLSSEEFYRSTAGRLNLSLSQEEFRTMFVDIFERIPETLLLISQLSPQYKIGLLSNTNEWHYESEIRTLDVLSRFDAVTVSFQVGAMKPSEKIYRDVLAKLAVPPEECLYIDDIKDYVDAAKRLGINAVQYVSHEGLKLSLRGFGIAV